jgi:hypothetical protein
MKWSLQAAVCEKWKITNKRFNTSGCTNFTSVMLGIVQILLGEDLVLTLNYFRAIIKCEKVILHALCHWFHLQFIRETDYGSAVSCEEWFLITLGKHIFNA